MKLMILVIIALFFYHIPLIGGAIQHILMIVVIIKVALMIPQILGNVISPRKVM